tara:strand:- start:5131 stop:7053 length:1923 start_codon:yes stop_codon:yes gene_type:complete
MDIDQDQMGDDVEETVELPVVVRGRSSGRILPLAMLETTLGSRIRAFTERAGLCVVIRVKSIEWVEPIAAAAKIMAHWRVVIDGDGTPRAQDQAVAEGLRRLAAGERILCVIPENLPVPPKFMAAADMVLHVDRIALSDVSKAIKLTTNAWPRGLKQSDVEGIELPQAISAIRVGATPAQCVRRLRGSKSAVSVDPLVASAPPLSQLAGYGEAQAWGGRLIADLGRWRAGQLDFSKIQKNAILAGPPGIGKSTYMRSLAKSAELPLFVSSVGTLFATTSGYLDSVIKGIDALFAGASAAGPAAIVFLDELEGFPRRDQIEPRHASWWTPVVNHVLTTLDSALSSSTRNLIVVGATNYPDRLDPALTRPGRLDRILWISHPDEKALETIYRQHLDGELSDIDLSGAVAISVGSTGADVAGFVKGARGRARQDGRDVQLQDLVDEICPPSTMTADDLWRACVHECGHALISTLLGTSEIKSIAVIGGNARGGRVVHKASTSAHIASAERHEATATQMLGGRAAEQVVFGNVSGGAGGANDSDLAKCSGLIAAAHLSYGLRDSLLYLAEPEDALTVARRFPSLIAVIGKEMEGLHSRAVELLTDHKAELLAVAGHLRQQRVMSGEQFAVLLDEARTKGGRPDA